MFTSKKEFMAEDVYGGCNNNKQYTTTYNTDRSSILITQHISKFTLAFHLTVSYCYSFVPTALDTVWYWLFDSLILPKVCWNATGGHHLFNHANTKATHPRIQHVYAHNLQDVNSLYFLYKMVNQYSQGLTTSQIVY